MKKILIAIVCMCFWFGNLNAQQLQKNLLTVSAGFGFNDDSHSIQSFSMGYQRAIINKLYIIGEYSGIQGNESFEGALGEVPQLNKYGELGAYEIGLGGIESSFARLLDVNVYSIGLKKYIQMTPKAYMAGSLSAATNIISKMDLTGIMFDENDNLIYENIHPTYGTYQRFGARVGLEMHYFIADKIGVNAKAEYLSVLSIVRFSVGTSLTF